MTRFAAAAFAALLAAPAFAADIAIEGAFARATPPGAMASAAYMTIGNDGAADDRLVAARTPAAQRVELHQHLMENGVARMREIEGGIPVPAGGAATLEPGGLHVMLMGLTGQLEEGASVPLTLVFERAGEITLEAQVRAIAPAGHGGG